MKKKLFKISLMTMLMLLFTFALFGCNNTNEINKFYKKIDKADSAEIVMTFIRPEKDDIHIDTKFYKNILFISNEINKTDSFIEQNGDFYYKYSIVGTEWQKSEIENATEYLNCKEELKEIFRGNNYLYSTSDKAFKMKEQVIVHFQEYALKSLTLKLSTSECKISGKIIEDGAFYFFNMEIKNINKIALELPKLSGELNCFV